MFCIRGLCGKFNKAKEKGSQLREPFNSVVNRHKITIGIFSELYIQIIIPSFVEFMVTSRAKQNTMFQFRGETPTNAIHMMQLQTLVVSNHATDIALGILFYKQPFHFLRACSKLTGMCLVPVLRPYLPNLALPILFHNTTSKVAVGTDSLTSC
jgi:hypothetical protein